MCELASLVIGSLNSGPATAVSKAARYHADFANMPGPSNLEDGEMALRDIKPGDALRANRAAKEVGQLVGP